MGFLHRQAERQGENWGPTILVLMDQLAEVKVDVAILKLRVENLSKLLLKREIKIE